MTQLTLIAARKVPCPRCGAKAGEPCANSSGEGTLRTVVHIARREAARPKAA